MGYNTKKTEDKFIDEMTKLAAKARVIPRKPLVFIAGPYSGGTYKEIDTNIKFAESYAVRLAKAEVFFICPHLNSRHFNTILPSLDDKFFLEMYHSILIGCDALLAIPGWRCSSGSRAEIDLATKLGTPVFYDVRKLIKWAKGDVNCEY